LPEQRRFRPGDRIRLAIVRGEEKREVSAVLEHFPLAIIRPELANFALAEDPLSLLCTLQEIQRPAAADAAGDPEVLARIGTDLGIKMRSPDTGYGVVITEFSEPRQQNLMWRHGFAVNDVIYNIDGQDVEDPAQLIELLDRMPSGAQLDVAYLRGGQKLRKVVTLPAEIRGLALRTVSWDVQHDAAQGVAEFRYRLDRTVDPGIDPAADGLEIVKRFVLPRRAAGQSAHHVRVELEIINHGAPRAVSYQLDGPNGLPVEGWWYTYKIGRRWGAAGIRDVAIYFRDDGPDVIGAPALVDGAEDDGVKSKDQPLRYAGVDARYFAAALVPQKPEGAADDIWLRRAIPIRVGLAPPRPHVKLTNTSVRLISRPYVLQPGEEHKLRHTYRLFLGPKRPELLAAEDPSGHLSELVYYGWFGWVSRPLVLLLHFFYGIVANYGLAIILLTVVVRACMLPLGIKQAQSAAKMQELQPEIRRINEKYKNNPEARMRATRELFQKHNYNPFGGCLLLFIQLPIFLGLYRALMIDVELRQAPLVPGLSWCGNLAAPDMLFNWEAFMPAFLADETGWLGPYFNVLPILTIVIFLIHQKMFMPPPADEQAASQQRLMKWMMILFAFMFFCVPSGLCIYFIASSLWGIAERKLIPKHAPVTAAPGATTRVSALEQRRQELREKQQREQGGDGRQKSTRDNKRRPPKAGRK
jgi:YidC/Oxa1 family membrane protein insertase